MNAKLKQFRFLLPCISFGVLLFVSLQQMHAQSAVNPSVKDELPDSVKVLRKKYGSKKTWEHLVSFPGTLVSLPLVFFLKGQEKVVGYVYEHKVIPKAKDSLTSADGRRGIMPRYTSRSGYGIKFFQRELISPESKLTLTITGTIHRRQSYRLWLQNVQFFGGILFSDFLIRYRFMPGENFFGIGPNSQKDARTNYDHELFFTEAMLGIRPTETFSIFTLLGYDHNDIHEGSDDEHPSTTEFFTEETLPGLESIVKMAHFQFGLKFNSKNRPGNPSKGNETLVTGTIFKEIDGARFDFWKVSADIKQYVHLFHKRVLVLRLSGEVTEPFSNKNIPFYYLSSLGRRRTIRGYNRGRFKDRDAVILSGEYRIPLWHSIDTILFLEAGQVSDNIFDDFLFRQFQLGYGIGFRIFNSERLISTLQFGISDEKFRVYFELN